VPVKAQTRRHTWERRAAVLRRNKGHHPTGPPRGKYYPRRRPPGGESQWNRGPGAKAGTKSAAREHPHPWCLHWYGDHQPTIRLRRGKTHPPRHQATRHQGGSPTPPPSAINPAGLSQTWRCGAPPAAPGILGRRTNQVPPEAGWRTATTPRKVESLSSAAALPSLTTRSAHPTQLGGRRVRPCRLVIMSGNTLAGITPRKAHAHGVDRGETPRATNTNRETGSSLASVEGLEATLTPCPLVLSVPFRSS